MIKGVRPALNEMFAPFKIEREETIITFLNRVDEAGQFDMQHVLRLFGWLLPQLEEADKPIPKPAKQKKK